MSKVQLQGNASGTGIFTIASPNSNTDRTLTLPDQTGTLLSSSAQGIPKSALPTGSILQMVNANQTTPTSVAAGTIVATPLQATITPTSATSKIVIWSCFQWYVAGGSSDATAAVYKNGSSIANGVIKVQSSNINQTVAFNYVDSPASTSALTYRIYINNGGSNSMTWNVDGYPTSLILMEVAA